MTGAHRLAEATHRIHDVVTQLIAVVAALPVRQHRIGHRAGGTGHYSDVTSDAIVGAGLVVQRQPSVGLDVRPRGRAGGR